jgi:hypothetical protein
MAAVDIPVTETTVTGVNPGTGRVTAVATVDGLSFANDGKTVLEVVATGAVVVTVVTPGTVEGQAVGDVASGTLAAADRRIMGPFNPANFNQPRSHADATLAGKVQVKCDTVNATLKAYSID